MTTPPRPPKTGAPAPEAAAPAPATPPVQQATPPLQKAAPPLAKAAPPLAKAAAPGPKAGPPTTPISAFVQLSALLTGFNASVIAPQIDPVDLKATFFSLVGARTGPAFDALLKLYLTLAAQVAPGKAVADMTPAQKTQIGNGLLGLGGATVDPQVAATAEAVMKLWYLGSWFQPFTFGAFAQDTTFGFVVSDQAYVKGLSWQAMQAHAMGNSTWTFGYWAKEPPALSAFTGNPAPTPPA